MPTFYRKTTTRKSPLVQRKSVVHKTAPKVATPTTRKATILPDDADMLLHHKPVHTPTPPIIEKVETEIEHRNPYVSKKATDTLQTLDDLLHAQPHSAKTSQYDEDENDNAIYEDDEVDVVEAFDGVSDGEEQQELYTEAIDYERKKAKAIEAHLKMLEAERESEKKKLEHEITKLKQELHRTVPIQDNKFFSLSKQLREAVKEIETLASQEGIQVGSIQPVIASPAPLSPPEDVKKNPEKVDKVEPKQEIVSIKEPEVLSPPEKKSLPKKKMLITGATAVVILMLVSGTLIKTITSEPTVDEDLVKQYLPAQSGQVQGATTGANGDTTQAQNPSAKVDASQADVTFEASVWEEFKDPAFGVLLQFPKNAVKPIRTESNITFIRKTGYLFKVQRIETALTLEEYWKQIKATSLNYSVSEDKFKGKAALKLELEDLADYPGDRYLIKEGNFIYDIWYATPSNSFAKDDVMRAEKMLSSLSIVGTQ